MLCRTPNANRSLKNPLTTMFVRRSESVVRGVHEAAAAEMRHLPSNCSKQPRFLVVPEP